MAPPPPPDGYGDRESEPSALVAAPARERGLVGLWVLVGAGLAGWSGAIYVLSAWPPSP